MKVVFEGFYISVGWEPVLRKILFFWKGFPDPNKPWGAWRFALANGLPPVVY